MGLKAHILTRLWQRADAATRRMLEGRLRDAGLLELLRTDRPDLDVPTPQPERPEGAWSVPQGFLEDFEERAAIMEFDGELPRQEAERLAEERVRQEFTRRQNSGDGGAVVRGGLAPRSPSDRSPGKTVKT